MVNEEQKLSGVQLQRASTRFSLLTPSPNGVIKKCVRSDAGGCNYQFPTTNSYQLDTVRGTVLGNAW